MLIVSRVSEVIKFRDEIEVDKLLGFVPTMGALHVGHLKLYQEARRECHIVIATLFVNPTQFNNAEDLKLYPRDEERDIQKLREAGVDLLFLPTAEEMYKAGNSKISIVEEGISEELCGRYRPGHFSGVLTIIAKFFALIRPAKAYFGEKDYQQLLLVRELATTFFPQITVIGVPTVRTQSGLAISSRNLRLSEKGIEKGALFAKILQQSKSVEEARRSLESLNITVEYLEEKYNRRFGAVVIEGVRLIDNAPL
jgi:pantoate--beta-alanine ligase